MSPAGTRGQGDRPGSASRHAAALSGNGIRAGARIAAGAMPGISSLGKGTIHGPSLDCSDASLDLRRTASGHGAAFSFPLCGGPSSLGIRREAAGVPSPGVGRQLHDDARCHGIDALETHHSHSASEGWRDSPWAHDGTQGNTRLLPLGGAGPRPRERSVIAPSQASEAVTFHSLNFSRASALAGPSRRDLTSTFVSASFANQRGRGRIPYDGNLTAKDGNVAR